MWRWTIDRHRWNCKNLGNECHSVSRREPHPVLRRTFLSASVALVLYTMPGMLTNDAGAASEARGHLQRARVYLAAGDYRRAVEACQRQIDEWPSAESYIYLTYVYQAIDGYLEHLSKHDRWVAVEQLYLNLAMRGTEDLTDPPDVLARIAKEIIQGSVRQQSDVTAAMAARLDQEAVARLWKLQTAWRTAKPESWWSGVPEGWNW
jgi:Tetratricopeptide repeat